MSVICYFVNDDKLIAVVLTSTIKATCWSCLEGQYKQAHQIASAHLSCKTPHYPGDIRRYLFCHRLIPVEVKMGPQKFKDAPNQNNGKKLVGFNSHT